MFLTVWLAISRPQGVKQHQQFLKRRVLVHGTHGSAF
jgi:hypothetical protein